MSPILIIKAASFILGVGSIIGGLIYIKTLIGENAILKESVKAATEYSIRVEDEVQAYTHALTILGDRDQEARDKRDEKFENIEKRNLTKMSERHPNNLVNILTGRTNRLLDDIKANSRSRTSETPTTSKTDTNKH